MRFMDLFLLLASKLGAQRHMAAIRDSFAMILPIVMAGSLVTVVNSFPIGTEEGQILKNILPSFIVDVNNGVWWGTFTMISFLLVFAMAYNLAKSYDVNGLGAGLIAFSTYVSIIPQSPQVGNTELLGEGVTIEAWGNINILYTDARALLVALLIAIVSTELYVRLSKSNKLMIKMPNGVPPAVSHSFAGLIPGMLTIIGVTALITAIQALAGSDLFALITTFVSTPLAKISNTLPSAIGVVFANHIFWVFGLHGSNIIEGVVQSVYAPLLLQNAEAYAAGLPVPYIVTKQFFDAFVYLGGCGATLGLIIAVFVMSKSKQLRTIAKLGIGPGAFEINEPVVFGLPIVLNPLFAIPFVLSPIVLTVISYFALSAGLVAKTVVFIPWSMPPILSGFITTGGDWRACILQIVNLTISVLIYFPFVLVADRQEKGREQQANNEKADIAV